jgi:hypothetical protein
VHRVRVFYGAPQRALRAHPSLLILFQVLVGGVSGAASSWRVSVGGCVKHKVLTRVFLSRVGVQYMRKKK